MTPTEHARTIDRNEFATECAAIRQRASAYVALRRQEDRTRVEKWLDIDTPAPKFNPPLPSKAERKRAYPTGKLHTIDGISLTLKQWAERIGVTTASLHTRIHRFGSLEAAVARGGPHKPGRPGVVSNLPASLGTGGGRTVQESPNITFSGNETCPQ